MNSLNDCLLLNNGVKMPGLGCVVTIPNSTHPDRIRENAQIFGFELARADINPLDALDEGRRGGPDPDNLIF